METRRGRRITVTMLCTFLLVLTFATTTGCDAVQAGGVQLGVLRAMPGFTDLPDSISGSLLTMHVETVEDEDEDEEFEYGSPFE